ncbi:unnamed protein product [Linum trigynum]|uniref:E2F/DP family winged-helix DNA-binding domain-containing protein n=1 Tax=Linum trigynum TaxID=586398 RepID=A0AAV2CP89_9ROSI
METSAADPSIYREPDPTCGGGGGNGNGNGGRTFYCRKEKSLGVLCTNFLNLYSTQGLDSIGLDDASSKLGVERRRIYDVVNILESVGVVARKQKNQYSWRGFAAIPHALECLKQEALMENFSAASCLNSAKALKENEVGPSSNVPTDGQENNSAASVSADNKREKSLWLLTQNFVKLFLCSDEDLITLDTAATTLLGDALSSTAMRTKVRRLYDIANVLASMNLIEKTHHPESRRPAFRWVGWRGNNVALDPVKFQATKRTFGTEITNFSSKKNRLGCIDQNHVIAPVLKISQDSQNKIHGSNLKPKTEEGKSKSFVFGPFSPAVTDKGVSCTGNTSMTKIQDVETLASTCYPQYCNEALGELFGHYVEAWKSWYAGASRSRKDPRRLMTEAFP